MPVAVLDYTQLWCYQSRLHDVPVCINALHIIMWAYSMHACMCVYVCVYVCVGVCVCGKSVTCISNNRLSTIM